MTKSHIPNRAVKRLKLLMLQRTRYFNCTNDHTQIVISLFAISCTFIYSAGLVKFKALIRRTWSMYVQTQNVKSQTIVRTHYKHKKAMSVFHGVKRQSPSCLVHYRTNYGTPKIFFAHTKLRINFWKEAIFTHILVCLRTHYVNLKCRFEKATLPWPFQII